MHKKTLETGVTNNGDGGVSRKGSWNWLSLQWEDKKVDNILMLTIYWLSIR